MRSGYISYKTNSAPKWTYISTNPVFCWLKPKEGTKKILSQVSGWHGCRETFVTEFKNQMLRNRLDGKPPYVPKNKLRIAMMVRIHRGYVGKREDLERKVTALQDNWALRATRSINVVEKYLGWPLTAVYKDNSAEARDKESKANVYIFASSSKWMRAPQLLSLYLLLIRLSSIRAFSRFSSLEKLLERMVEVSKGYRVPKNDRLGLGDEDRDYGVSIAPYLKDILDNADKLFFSRTLDQNFLAQNGCFGIYGLIEHRAWGGDKHVKDLYEKLIVKKNKID